MTVTKKTQTDTDSSKPKIVRQFVNFTLYEIDARWRRLARKDRERGKEQFERTIELFQSRKRCQILTFSTMGLRSDGDFMLWTIAKELEALQELATALSRTEIGKYLTRKHSFLGMTKRSMYMDRFRPEYPETRAFIIPGRHKYLFLYPFTKNRQWYQLPFDKRQEMMEEHIRITKKFPSIKLSTIYSLGFDDPDFVVVYESESPVEFLDLRQELRETQASAYIVNHDPMISAIAMSTRDMLDALGG